MSEMQIPLMLQPGTTGAFEAKIFDPNAEPVSIVTDTQAFTVECEWYLDSPMIGFINGLWRLQVAFESIGGGPEGARNSVPQTTSWVPGTPVPGHPARRAYRDTVDFPAGSLPLDGNPQRAYHLTALLSSRNATNTQPGPFAAYYDLGVIQVMDAN